MCQVIEMQRNIKQASSLPWWKLQLNMRIIFLYLKLSWTSSAISFLVVLLVTLVWKKREESYCEFCNIWIYIFSSTNLNTFEFMYHMYLGKMLRYIKKKSLVPWDIVIANIYQALLWARCCCWQKKKKKSTAWKLRIMFYMVDKTEDLSPGCSLSDSSERLLWRGEGEVRIYRSFCNKDEIVKTSKDYC